MDSEHTNLPATAETYDAYAAYGAQASRSRKPILKFSKGFYYLGKDAEPVAIGTKVAVNMAEFMIGWTRWADGKPAEDKLVRLVDGRPPALRDTLGYDDKSAWELDDKNQPRDPWQFGNVLPGILVDHADLLEVELVAGNKGQINAFGELCTEFGKQGRQHAGQVPVLQLGADSYLHGNKAYGRIHYPVLKIVGWIDPNTLTPAQGALPGTDDTVKKATKF